MQLTGWSSEQIQSFLTMQFHLQHAQYMHGYQHPSFDIILLGQIPVGRLYINRLDKEIRIIDISLLADYRGPAARLSPYKSAIQ